MSRKDIETVCTLAAHLTVAGFVTAQEKGGIPALLTAPDASRCAADAMTLQRLAQNIRHKARDIQRMAWGIYLRGMTEKAEAVLKPYGLVGELSAAGITVLGLPGNTLGGDEDGFGV